MNSPEDSSSSSTQKISVWADQQTATAQPGVSPPSPTHCFGDGEGTSSAIPAETPISTNPSCPSQTLVSPPKKRTAEKGPFDASQPQGERRKRGRPRKHKKPQTDTEHHIHQSPTATHPCLQPEDQTEAVTLTPSSPVIPEDRCQSPEATFEPPCPALDLQSANKGQSKNGPHLSSASVGQGDLTGPNVLTTGSITATEIFISKCAKEQRTLCQSPQNLKDGRKAANKSQIHKVDQPQETVTNGENTSKPLLTIKVGQENCLTQKTVQKRKYTKKSQSHKVGQPRDTDQSQESETVRNGENTSIKSPTHKIDWSQVTVRKRTYTKKPQTPKVDQSQEESVTRKKRGSKISPTHKGEQSQEMVTKRKSTKRTQSHKGGKPQETVRNGRKTTMKSPTHQVNQSQELVTKRKKVSKVSSTHKVDHPQETVKKRKYTKKSQTREIDQSQSPETGKNTSMKWLTNKVASKKSQTREIDQSQSPETGKNTSMKWLTNKVASKKSQSHTVEQSLGIDQSQETVRKRNYTKKSRKHKEDSHETVRNGEKTSKKSQKVELRDTEQSQEETVKNRKYTKKSKTHKVASGVLSFLPVLSADLNLSSPTFSSTGLPKRKYTRKSQSLKVDSDVPSSLIVLSADLSSSLQSSLSPTRSPSGIPFSPNTPKRVRGRPQRVQQQLFLSSTPGPHPRSSTGTDTPFSASLSHLGLGPQNASPITPWKAAAEGGSQTFSSEEGPPAKLRRRSRKDQTAEGAGLQSGYTTSTEPRSRPRFELQESDSPDTDTGDASLSSDLSIELSVQEDRVTSLTLEEEEEQDDEEDLPSFLNNTKPLSITEGICVWCKFRNYPFWPAMVKSVNRKLKKASIVFIDDLLFDKKRIRKGFSVSLKTLKPFDCEEADQLVCKAREKYDAAIKWCLALIADYRIRIGCGFTGSFIEYFSDDISCPVRRCYPRGTSDLTFPSKLILEEQYVTSDPEGDDQEGSKRQEEERRRKLLPDRSKAARNRANEKLVDFVVRQRRVETRLLGVISGQQQSKWLRWFLAASRSVVDTYLEDEEQLDQVYQYLRGVYETAPLTAPCLADVDLIRLVLDVLLPEAIIYAIAGVDELSLVKAEDKYLKGPCLSKREREEFDAMIEQQMKTKASIRQHPAH